MQYIYIDESGDLGFDFRKKGTSRYFVVAAIVTGSPKSLQKIVSTIHNNLRKKFKMRSGTIHATSEEMSTRKRLCRSVASQDCEINVFIIDKHRYKNGSEKIYTEMIWKHIELYKDNNTSLVLSRRYMNKFMNTEMIKELKVRAKCISIEILTELPSNEKVLQVADMINWVLFQKYEHGDEKFFNIIKKKIKHEVLL